MPTIGVKIKGDSLVFEAQLLINEPKKCDLFDLCFAAPRMLTAENVAESAVLLGLMLAKHL
jgi:hypothetical protein